MSFKAQPKQFWDSVNMSFSSQSVWDWADSSLQGLLLELSIFLRRPFQAESVRDRDHL